MITITLSRTLEKKLLRCEKLSKSVIQHIQKCLKYAFAMIEGDKTRMEENLRAIIPHQFWDYSSCHSRFSGNDRKSAFTEAYLTKLLSRMAI